MKSHTSKRITPLLDPADLSILRRKERVCKEDDSACYQQRRSQVQEKGPEFGSGALLKPNSLRNVSCVLRATLVVTACLTSASMFLKLNFHGIFDRLDSKSWQAAQST
jgi:hypothetical protein